MGPMGSLFGLFGGGGGGGVIPDVFRNYRDSSRATVIKVELLEC